MSKKVLLMLGGGYHRFDICGPILNDYLKSYGGLDVTATEDRQAFANLDGYDAIVDYTQGGELTPQQENGLLSFVRNGGGFVGIHCVCDSFTKNEGFMEMLGCQFAAHGPVAPFNVEHTDDYEQIAPRLAKTWQQHTDEFYIIKMRTQQPVRPFQHGWWENKRHVLGYVRDYGKGRVFFTALGHHEQVFRSPEFQDLILKGTRYVMRETEKERPARWGIVGYDPAYGMGARHAEFVQKTTGFQLAAVCDTSPQRVEEAKKTHGPNLAYFTDVAELIKSNCCDGATVIVPHNIHADLSIKLLEAGKHVICEKPMAITPEECDRMIAAAKQSNVKLGVYHNRHWDDDIWTLRQIIDAGMIGEVFSIEYHSWVYKQPVHTWRSHKEISGGLLYDWGTHIFAKILELIPRMAMRKGGPAPVNRKAMVYGHLYKKVWWDTTNDEFGRAYMKFDNGVEAMFSQSYISTAQRPGWTISGSKGSCVVGAESVEVRRYENGQIATTTVPLVKGLTYQSFYRNFADHMLAGAPLTVSLEFARATIQCIHACEVSARENRLVEVDFTY